MAGMSGLLPKEPESELKAPVQSFTQEKANEVWNSEELIRLYFNHTGNKFEKCIETEILRSFKVDGFDECFHLNGITTVELKIKVGVRIVEYVINWMYDKIKDVGKLSRHPNDASLTVNGQPFGMRDSLQLWMLFHKLGIKFAATEMRKTFIEDLDSAATSRNYLRIDEYIPHANEQRDINRFKEPRDILVRVLGEFWPHKFTDDFKVPQLANFRSIMPPGYDLRRASEAAAGNTFDEYKEWKLGKNSKKPEGFELLIEEDQEIVEQWWAATFDVGIGKTN